MRSMTGFGHGSAVEGGLSVRVEMGSVNRKAFDSQISLPRGLGVLEGRCLARVQERVRRGRLQVRVQVERAGGGGGGIDVPRAVELLRELNAFAAEQGLEPVSRVSELLRLAGTMRESAVEETDVEEVWGVMERALEGALEELDGMRAREGALLGEALERVLRELEEVVAEMEPLLPEARAEMEAKLRAALAGLGTASTEVEARLLQEIALYGERADIREELDRIGGHLTQFRERLGQEGPVGRPLDFLCQELAREFNTLSVKASRADINRLALAGKERVEMLREQVQNVE